VTGRFGVAGTPRADVPLLGGALFAEAASALHPWRPATSKTSPTRAFRITFPSLETEIEDYYAGFCKSLS